MVKIIKNAPGWLGLSTNRTSFVYLSKRAEIVRQIFQLSIGGFGGYAIAKLLNKKQIPGFGSSKKWDKSTVDNILTSRVTIGEYQRKQKIDGKLAIVGDPIPNYYPALIDAATFEAAQIARQNNMANRSGRRGPVIANLFFGLASCSYCSEAMKIYYSSDRSLICSKVLSGHGKCPRFAWTYSDFENVFIETLDAAPRYSELTDILRALRNSSDQNNEVDLLDARMSMTSFLRRSIESITIAVAGAQPPAPKPQVFIRRDHPSRLFSVKFMDGFSLVGFPRLLEPSPPSEPKGRKIPSVELQQLFGLSPRQAEITSLLVQGFSLKQAAEKLGQTLETGRWHLREIFRRTNTHSQSELIVLAKRSCPGVEIAAPASDNV